MAPLFSVSSTVTATWRNCPYHGGLGFHAQASRERAVGCAKGIYCPGAPHGLTATHQDQVNRDLLISYGVDPCGTRDAGLSH